VVFVLPVGERPLPRHPIREANSLEYAPYDQAVGSDDIVVVLTIGTGPVLRNSTEEKVGHCLPRASSFSLRFQPIKSSLPIFLEGAKAFVQGA
jgi:hypothetical protein